MRKRSVVSGELMCSQVSPKLFRANSWIPLSFGVRQQSKPLQYFSIVTLIPSGLPSRILTCTLLKGHWLCLF